MLYLHTQGSTLNLHYLAITSISTQAYKNVLSSRVNVKTLCTALTIVAKTSDRPNKVRPAFKTCYHSCHIRSSSRI